MNLPIYSNLKAKLESKGLDSINSTIYFMGIALTGGSESNKPHNECFFGELDSKDSNLGLNTLKPIYQLISNSESVIVSEAKHTLRKQFIHTCKSSNTNIASKSNNTASNNALSTLNIFLGSNTLTLLNYSLLESNDKNTLRKTS